MMEERLVEQGDIRARVYTTREVSMFSYQSRRRRAEAFRSGRFLPLLCGLLAFLMLCFHYAAAQSDQTDEIIHDKIEQLRQSQRLRIGGTVISSPIVIPDFYEQRNFRLAWVNRAAIEDLFRAIRESEADGLDPRDYHLIAFEQLRRSLETSPPPTPVMLADFDILLTDALIRLSYHLIFGKVDPERLDARWNMAREINGFEPAVIVRQTQQALDSNSLYQTLDAEKPKHAFYTALKAALAHYRAIKTAGGWPRIPAGPTLKLGMQDPRIPLLQRRLTITGDLAHRPSNSSLFYDSAIEGAVKTFQRRHGFTADGSLGPGTLAALNVPVEERIQQVRVNLERARWVLHNLGETFIVVNVAAYHAYYMKDGHILWQGRTMVGKPYRQTPIFKAELAYLVFNPTWTVPPTILSQDYLPALRQDPSYLNRKGLKVIDRAGRVVNAAQIDWSQYSPRHAPYLLRQDPGPRNALGRVKFMFPNDHAVYLHDTPSQALFNRAERAFSSGCIRVEGAVELARLVLNDEAEWNPKGIDRILESGKTRTVFLHEPIPVLILYWTAWVGSDGRVNFRHDLYGRDQVVQQELASSFRFRKRHIVRVPLYSSHPTPLEIRDQE
jgi:murein L,D-transpeptidase YcbB/YkuD